MTILAFLKILGCLGLLMYGMKLMGEGLQKMAGNQLRRILDSLTTNRFTSFFTGAVITAIIQSSSATSVMTISFVHAGLLTFVQGLSLIMGASIGNTLIAWIMALEFNYAISYYIFAFFCVAMCLVNTRSYRSQGESLFGLCFMFLGLRLLCEFAEGDNLTQATGFVQALSYFNEGYWGYFLLILIGAVMILLVQSSAALLATSMILCSTGLFTISSGIALVLGENLGRAIITSRAASSAHITARRVGAAQLIFNLTGILWSFAFLPYLSDILLSIWKVDPKQLNLSAYILATFHTSFNLANVLLFIGLINPLERFATYLIPKQDQDEEEDGELRYITGGLLATPELSVLEAQKEITSYAEMTQRMFHQVRCLLPVKNTHEFQQIYMRIKKSETLSDELEEEIADYLNKVSDDLLSSETKSQIRCMLREVSELESVADSCYNIARIIGHKYHGKEQFSQKQLDHLHQLFLLTDQALQEMIRILTLRRPPSEARTIHFINMEVKKFRSQLRRLNAIDVNNHEYSYHVGTMYLDIINECEKIGEYILNTIEARIESVEKPE